MTPNYSLHAIPAYILVAMLPHVYSILLLRSQRKRWDNVSPRSAKFQTSLQKSMSPECLAKFERCRAAHDNMMENMAYFIGAVLAGNMAHLPASFMNKCMLWYFVSRAVYLVSYIQTEKLQLSHLRSVVYTGGFVVLTVVYVKAGMVLQRESSIQV